MNKVKVRKKKAVKWEDDVKNPANRLAVNDVKINRDTPVDAPKTSIFRAIFPKKVSQEEYNKFYDIKD
jgi:hypothetical protein